MYLQAMANQISKIGLTKSGKDNHLELMSYSLFFGDFKKMLILTNVFPQTPTFIILLVHACHNKNLDKTI